jgi:hypothetical protein
MTRQLFDWSIIETEPGHYYWVQYDAYIEDLSRAGFGVLPILHVPPAFYSSRPEGDTTPGVYPPTSNDSMAAFAVSAVERYGPDGSFWSEHPSVPKRPLRAWQIWNEPTIPGYWLPGPDPAAYTEMLKVVGGAIRNVDPGAEIVSGGVPHNRKGLVLTYFLKGMYDAGAKGSFDTLALHPYALGADGVYGLVKKFRDLLDEHGDNDKRIWVSELGWATGGPANPFNIGETGQSELMKRAFATLAANSAALKLRGILYNSLRDLPPAPGTADFWGLHTGLVGKDGRAKPGLAAFKSAVDRLTAAP